MRIFLLFLSFLVLSSAQADQLVLLRDDGDALQARVDIIQRAKHEILVEYFSVWNDDQSIGGIALLMAAAKRGVKVKVIVDALSNTVPKKTFAALLQEGKDKDGNQNLEIKEYNPLGFNIFKATHRDHAKMIVVDGEIIITGGRNVGDKYFGISRIRNFSDLDLMGRGNVAAVARENFIATWNAKHTKVTNLGKFDPEKLHEDTCRYYYDYYDFDKCERDRKNASKRVAQEVKRIHAILNEIMTVEDDDIVNPNSDRDWFAYSYEQNNLEFVSHGTETLVSEKTAYLNEKMMSFIANAKTDVNIISPYLIPTEELYNIFKELLARGVRIRIITNSLRSTDNLFAQAGYRQVKPLLIKLGIEVYEYEGPDTIHAKTAVVDNEIAMIGTYNIDPRSAYINREIAIFVKNEEQTGFINELEMIIDDFRGNSTLVGKNKEVFNQELELAGVSRFKRAILKSITFILPWIKNQL